MKMSNQSVTNADFVSAAKHFCISLYHIVDFALSQFYKPPKLRGNIGTPEY